MAAPCGNGISDTKTLSSAVVHTPLDLYLSRYPAYTYKLDSAVLSHGTVDNMSYYTLYT